MTFHPIRYHLLHLYSLALTVFHCHGNRTSFHSFTSIFDRRQIYFSICIKQVICLFVSREHRSPPAQPQLPVPNPLNMDVRGLANNISIDAFYFCGRCDTAVVAQTESLSIQMCMVPCKWSLIDDIALSRLGVLFAFVCVGLYACVRTLHTNIIRSTLCCVCANTIGGCINHKLSIANCHLIIAEIITEAMLSMSWWW